MVETLHNVELQSLYSAVGILLLIKMKEMHGAKKNSLCNYNLIVLNIFLIILKI
jgi:hypothetical protein